LDRRRLREKFMRVVFYAIREVADFLHQNLHFAGCDSASSRRQLVAPSSASEKSISPGKPPAL
jgi:hypothetical protein